MQPKPFYRTSSFWSLFTINLAIVVYYLQNGTGFKTLVWIYWMQSVLIGFFTFLQLATLKEEKAKDGTLESAGYSAGFFVLHFGLFHLIYFIFIFTITDAQEVFDWQLFWFSLGAFSLDQLWNFIQYKQWEQTHHPNVGTIFSLPYARVLPMHLTILLPQFFGFIPQLGLFLVLKMLADLAMYVATSRIYGRQALQEPASI